MRTLHQGSCNSSRDDNLSEQTKLTTSAGPTLGAELGKTLSCGKTKSNIFNSLLLLLGWRGRQFKLLHGALHRPANVSSKLDRSLAQGCGYRGDPLTQLLNLVTGTDASESSSGNGEGLRA